ncbi:MAG TPA: hypothetical protein PLM00_01635 [Spirochaetota bacterium]|nr:hypothetical protein [Spirochaetota bacterium]
MFRDWLAWLYVPYRVWARIAESPFGFRQVLLRVILPWASLPLVSALFVFLLADPTLTPCYSSGISRIGCGLSYGLLLALTPVFSILVAARVLGSNKDGAGAVRRWIEIFGRSWVPLWIAAGVHVIPPVGGFALLSIPWAAGLLYRGFRHGEGCPVPEALERVGLGVVVLLGSYGLVSLVLAAVLRELFGGGAFIF